MLTITCSTGEVYFYPMNFATYNSIYVAKVHDTLPLPTAIENRPNAFVNTGMRFLVKDSSRFREIANAYAQATVCVSQWIPVGISCYRIDI